MKTLTLCLLLFSVLLHQCFGASITAHSEAADSAEHLASPNMMESHLQEAPHRIRRFSHLSICRFCCGCCKRLQEAAKDCGICCVT
ncbi:hepcidin-2-like [Engystomops pustulosus]|uniref:hepcidin-2-like n=1 Tax=Engystomops pustulosus TaxID=76066 RepID=UPI003AFA06E0